MYLANADLGIYAGQACQNINRQAVLTWGDWEGEMRGAMLMPKGPQGLSAMEFACLGVV